MTFSSPTLTWGDLPGETYGENESGLGLCQRIGKLRPELPIFLRREAGAQADLDPEIQSIIAGTYTLADIDSLQKLIDEFVFSMYYPAELAQGIQEISSQAFTGMMHGMNLSCDCRTWSRTRLFTGTCSA